MLGLLSLVGKVITLYQKFATDDILLLLGKSLADNSQALFSLKIKTDAIILPYGAKTLFIP